jgi:D-sedoheptulose 7-phosphate isomerase
MTFPVEWVDPSKKVEEFTPWFSKNRLRFHPLAKALESVEVEEHGWVTVQNLITLYGLGKPRIFFIGNGGSAAVASHMAIDWSKNGGFATFGPGDAAHMTCISNDISFENVYSHLIDRHGQLGDVLFAISSSGMSGNILHAVHAAKDKRMNVITLSGFGKGNFLRGAGQVNFYVPASQYGTVEISHLAILHSILDEVMAAEKCG